MSAGGSQAGISSPVAFDISRLHRNFLDNPFPVYRALRESDPVHRNEDGSYFLTRHADLETAYKHPAMSSDKRVEFRPNFGDSPLYAHHTTSLVFNDDPYHKRVRKLLSGAFTPRKLKELEPRVHAVVDGLLDTLEEKGAFDLIGDYAFVLPTEIIADMLGIHRERRALLRDYSAKILGALDPVISRKTLEAGNAAVEEFGAYLAELIAERRRHPNAAAQGEVLTALIFGEVDGERLSEEELVQNCIFLLNAGHETTANLTANAICLLMDHPGERRKLLDDPSLIDGCVEECLRYDSPVQLGNRKATAEVEVGGTTIPADSFLHLAIGGANRDPAVFEDPERFDIARAHNPHHAFAGGKHMCLGATLSRIEGRIAVGKFIRRFRDVHPDGPRERLLRARFRGYARAPVAVR
jgi:cytochrome P450